MNGRRVGLGWQIRAAGLWCESTPPHERLKGGSARAHRPHARCPPRGAFDVVLVWRFDRFVRSIEQLVLALSEFRTLVSSQEALDTSTPMVGGCLNWSATSSASELWRGWNTLATMGRRLEKRLAGQNRDLRSAAGWRPVHRKDCTRNALGRRDRGARYP